MLREESKKEPSSGLPEPKEIKDKIVSAPLPSSPSQKDSKKKASSKTTLAPTGKDESLKELIEKNIKWSQVIYDQNKKIKKRLGWMVAGSYLKLILIIAPIIIAMIYLPPLMEQFMAQYSQLLGAEPGRGGIADIVGQMFQFNNILQNVSPEDIKEVIKNVPK